MVVTRRTPVVPPPQLARNHSSQGVQRPPRSSFSKDTTGASKDPSSMAATPLAGTSNGNRDHHNGLDNDNGNKSRRSRRRRKNKYPKSNFQAFLDFLTKLLLLAFTIYTFSVCPQDTHLQSPICRGLSEYKRIVLDPYIIPPIQAVLAHPSVAPHIEHATPYVHRAVEITYPILLRTQQEWNLHVVPQWEKRIVPAFKKCVVPPWNNYIVPQWDKHVVPRIQLIQSKVEPYHRRVMDNYEQRVLPRAQVAFYNVRRWQRQAEPYVLLAATKTKAGYYATKPYAIPIAKRCAHLLQQFALFLQGQRQKFVDPHVAKMWEKVKELSRGRQVIHEAMPEPKSPSPDVSFTVLETLGDETTASPACAHSETPLSDAIPTPRDTDDAYTPSSLSSGDTIEIVAQPTFAEPIFTLESKSATPTQFAGTPTGVDSFPGAEPMLFESLDESEPRMQDTSPVEEEPDSVTSSILVAATATTLPSIPPIADEPATPLASVAPSKVTVAAAKATVPPENPRADDEIDFDAFYAELGLNEPLENLGSSDASPPSPPAETEEERTERLRLKAEEIARKRADIEARQTKWEVELQAQVERSTSQLQSRLAYLRTAAAAELELSAEVRNSIEELVNEAEKYLKGAEIYLKNLKGESRRSDEKLALWDRVADRVNDKFNERLLATEKVFNDWYSAILDQELQEVATVAAEVREVAEKGQLDLGLDYAWLEDVTYNDWQRYHTLIGSSEQYAHEAASIQNGTHPEVVVANPMNPILQDLESEVQDVVIGFETRMRRIKRDGERAFNAQGNGAGQKEDEKGSNVEPVGAVPEASILPVPGERPEVEREYIPPVVIGRSQEEVLEALGRAGPVSEAATGSPVKASHVDPEEAVSRLAREVEGGAKIVHTEL